MNWFLSPNVILAACIAVGGLGLGAYHVAKVSSAFKKGEAAGAAAVTLVAVKKVEATVAAVAAGAAEAPPIPEDKKLLRELCDRSASCRSRKR